MKGGVRASAVQSCTWLGLKTKLAPTPIHEPTSRPGLSSAGCARGARRPRRPWQNVEHDGRRACGSVQRWSVKHGQRAARRPSSGKKQKRGCSSPLFWSRAALPTAKGASSCSSPFFWSRAASTGSRLLAALLLARKKRGCSSPFMKSQMIDHLAPSECTRRSRGCCCHRALAALLRCPAALTLLQRRSAFCGRRLRLSQARVSHRHLSVLSHQLNLSVPARRGCSWPA